MHDRADKRWPDGPRIEVEVPGKGTLRFARPLLPGEAMRLVKDAAGEANAALEDAKAEDADQAEAMERIEGAVGWLFASLWAHPTRELDAWRDYHRSEPARYTGLTAKRDAGRDALRELAAEYGLTWAEAQGVYRAILPHVPHREPSESEVDAITATFR